MASKIARDRSRFKKIVRGRIRQNLRKYISHGEMIGRKGRDLVSIPVPNLEVPHFRFGKNGNGGVGAEVDLDFLGSDLRTDKLLFSETSGFLLEIRHEPVLRRGADASGVEEIREKAHQKIEEVLQ